MTPVLLGQVMGMAFACGLNLYITVAALGLLSRFGVIEGLPTGLRGLEGLVVIGTALALYLIEAVIDKVRHVDSLWDTVHTFIRPPAAALLAIGALWAEPLEWKIAGAAFAFFVALAAHGTKAGLRVALNTGITRRRGPGWISVAEDVTAVAFAVAALEAPSTALVAAGGALVLIILFGHRFFRAFALGLRCLAAWLRSLFGPPRWREADELPRSVRGMIGDAPLGAAPPRGTRAGVNGVPGVGAYRNGWLVITSTGPVFHYRTLFGSQSTALPTATEIDVDRGIWADLVRVRAQDGNYTLYLLKDGPGAQLAASDLHPMST